MTDREIQALCKHLKVPKFMCDTQDSRNVLAQIYAAGQAQAARRCADIVHDIAVELVTQEGVIKRNVLVYEQGIGAERCEQAIRAEFAEAFK